MRCESTIKVGGDTWGAGSVTLHCARTDVHSGSERDGGEHRAKVCGKVRGWGLTGRGNHGLYTDGWWFITSRAV